MQSAIPDIRTEIFEDENIDLEEAPIYKGATSFEALPGVSTILITGGAGFTASWLVDTLS